MKSKNHTSKKCPNCGAKMIPVRATMEDKVVIDYVCPICGAYRMTKSND